MKPPQAARAVDQQGAGSVLEFYKEMIGLRKRTPDLIIGKTAFLDIGPGGLAFIRGAGTFCAFNLSKTPIVLDRRVKPALAQGFAQGRLDAHGFVIGQAG